MKRWHVALLVVAGLSLLAAPAVFMHGTRSVRPLLTVPSPERSKRFDPRQSAALFVGVRQFTKDESLIEVSYAVDDAIDLAYAFALAPNVCLVSPEHVVLALSGTAYKTESQERLRALKAAGAIVSSADQADVLMLLQQQAASVGPDGLFVISMASHGFSSDGAAYILTAGSLRVHPETSISTNKLLDIAATSNAGRSLVFLDACRDRVESSTRGGEPDPRSAAPLLKAMGDITGQVAFYAAAAGKYAYDDDERRNGVFTAAVLDGIQCGASRNERGFVTAETLSDYVEANVRSWVRKHRDPSLGNAIQVNMDVDAKAMPLAVCDQPASVSTASTGTPPPPPPPGDSPARVDSDDTTIDAFSESGMHLWQRSVDGHIARAEAADLDGDGRNEVIVGLDGGRRSGQLVVFDAAGREIWLHDTNAASNYGRTRPRRSVVRSFITADLFRKRRRQIVAISDGYDDASTSRLTIIEPDGKLRSTYWHPGRMQQILVAQHTSHHAVKLIVSAVNRAAGDRGSVFMLDPKKIHGEAPPYRGKLGRGTQLWYGSVLPASQTITRLQTVDRDGDEKSDIEVTTSAGHVFDLDFEGHMLGSGSTSASAHLVLLASRR